MAVREKDRLKPEPRTTGLPKSIRLTQTLWSSQPPETVSFEYTLPKGSHHCFANSSDPKKVTRPQKVISGTQASPTPIQHTVRLVCCAGDPRDWAVITQQIVGGGNRRYRVRVRVNPRCP